MSSKIVGWLVRAWDGKISDKKNLKEEEKIFWNKSKKGESYIFASVSHTYRVQNKLSKQYKTRCVIWTLNEM